ncbi:MAG: sugar ABC transporter permease, partial [Eubacteriales bacterium]|nr:sugar ABC transporter permease [Eubacteriales bacterium]
MHQAKRAKNPDLKSEQFWAYAFVSPMLLGYLLFVLVPIAATMIISLTDWSLIRTPNWVGLDNYRTLMSDTTFHATIVNTLYFTALLLPSNLVLCLALASLLKSNFPGVGFFRTAVFTPVVTSVVVWGIIWKYIFQTDNGIINVILNMFDINGPHW